MIVLRNISLNEKLVDILIDGKIISRIVPAGTDPEILMLRNGEECEVVDCKNLAVVPGFVNAHTHAAMTLMRGVSEDEKLEAWLDRIWQIESRIDDDFVYWGTKVAALEMIKTGTTTFNDQYWRPINGYRAAADMALRSTISAVLLDHFDKEEAEKQKELCEMMYEDSKNWPDTSSLAISIHSVYTVCEDMILWGTEFARKRGLRLHIHLSESQTEVENCKAAHGGLTPTAYFDRLGVLGPDVIAAHTLHLTDEDVEILGRRHVNCVHNINSNLKISSGYRFRYDDLSAAGANVCIGTDGCASSNNLDMLEAMKTSALLQKGWRGDPTAMPLVELLACATKNGAKALGLNAGVVEEGALADLILVDTDNTFFLSPGPFLANFIYSAHSDSIKSLICNGRFLMKDRVCTGEAEILENARKAMKIIM